MKEDILSIDVDAHLEKLVTGTYRSPLYFAVELVRSALKREAERVRIQVKKKQFIIQDDGECIGRDQMEKLKALLDRSTDDATREQAIIDLQDPEGIGILAMLSPSPREIELSSSDDLQKMWFLFRRGSVPRFQTSSPGTGEKGTAKGTRIQLTRKGRSWEAEIQILGEYCRGVQKEIWLNGRLISKKSLFRNSLASMRISPASAGVSGEIGIPEKSDVCRIWILDRGIPLTRKIIAPWKGFVFDAAVEYGDEINGKLLNGILGDVVSLYQYLIQNWKKFSSPSQKRIEQLVFQHHRLSQSRLLVDQFPVFYSLSDQRFHSAASLKRISEKNTLYVIPEQKGAEEYDLAGKMVFQLNDGQIDYLANYCVIRFLFLSPRGRPGRLKKIFAAFPEMTREILGKIHAPYRNPIPAERLTHSEKKLISLLFQYPKKTSAPESADLHFSEIAFIPGRGLFPSIKGKGKRTLWENHLPVLLIRRFHPIVQKSIQAINRDPENIEFIAPLFY